MLKPHHGTIWLCEDCALAAHGLADERDPDYVPERTPLDFIEPGDVLTPGMLSAEHECAPGDERAENCDCEHITYSTRRCDGCGDPDAGSRDAFTLWWD